MRRAHFVRPNRSSSTPSVVIALDTETTSVPIGPDAVEARLVFGWIAVSRRHRGTLWTKPRWTRFETPAEAWNSVERECRAGWRVLLVAHNAGFDFRVLAGFRELSERGWTLRGAVIDDPPTILRYRRDRASLVIMDSLNWYRARLADVGVGIGLPKLDHDLCWGSRELDDAYCRRDVEIVLRAVQLMVDRVRDWDLGNFAATLPAQAYTAWRHRHLHHRVLIDDHPRALDLARRAYHGGRTEAWRLGEIAGPVVVYDVVSMYPAVMTTTPMPTVLRSWARHCSVATLRALVKRSCVIADVTIATDRADYPIVHEGRLIFPVGRFRAVLTTPELVHALRSGHVMSVHELAIYDRAILFDTYVHEWHARRSRAIAEGRIADATLSKLMMNALYGKFGQRGRVFSDVGDAPPDEVRSWVEIDADTGTVRHYRTFGGRLQERSDEVESRESHPAIAAHVTAAARMRLLGAMERAGRMNIVYADTDSLFALPPAVGTLDSLVRPGRLGWLKRERTLETLTIHALKDYTADGVRKTKGIRSNADETGPATFSQDTFVGLKGALRGGDINRQVIRRTVKRLARTYDKGNVDVDGRVTPYRLD